MLGKYRPVPRFFKMSAKSRKRSSRQAEPSEASDPPQGRVWAIVLLAVVILFSAAIRFRTRNLPLERDEGEYAYAGQLMLQGIPPYTLAYNMKLPGTYAAYAVIMTLFGQTPAGIHLGMIVVSTVSIILVFLIGRRLWGSIAGLVAAASFGLLTTHESVLGLAGHANHFVVLAALAGILFMLKALEARRTWLYLVSGVFMGLSFVLKQSGIVFVAFGAWHLIMSIRPELKTRRALGWVVSYGAGTAVPFALTCLWMLLAGRLERMWFWTFSYASQYASLMARWSAWDNFFVMGSQVVQTYPLIWLFAALGLAALAWDTQLRKHSRFILGLLFFSWCGVCMGFYFRPHYFLLVLPAVSFLAGITVSTATREIARISDSAAIRAVPAVVFAVAMLVSIVSQGDQLFHMDMVAISRAAYGTSPFPETEVISGYLKDHASPHAKVAVLGSEPEVYFLSKLHSATGYIYVYPLFERQKFALQMQKEMAKQIEDNRPEYIVLVKVVTSWQVLPGAERWILTWFKSYLRDNYEIVGVADEVKPETRYVWGQAAKGYSAESEAAVEVYRRLSPSSATSSAAPAPKPSSETAPGGQLGRAILTGS